MATENLNNLSITDAEMQAIIGHRTIDVGFDIEQILAGLEVNVASIFGSYLA